MMTVSFGKGLMGITAILILCGVFVGLASADTDLLNWLRHEAEAERMHIENEYLKQIKEIDAKYYQALKHAEAIKALGDAVNSWQQERELARMELEQQRLAQEQELHDKHEQAMAELRQREAEHQMAMKEAEVKQRVLTALTDIGVPAFCAALLMVTLAYGIRITQRTGTQPSYAFPTKTSRKHPTSQDSGWEPANLKPIPMPGNIEYGSDELHLAPEKELQHEPMAKF